MAINQAGAYIRKTGMSVLAYTKSYNETWRGLMETQHRFAFQGALDRSVLTTWTLLFGRLQKRNENAAKLLICGDSLIIGISAMSYSNRP